jgi:hypothetical protein
MMGGTSGGKGYSLRRMAGKVANKLFVVIKDMPSKHLLKYLPFILFAFAVEGSILLLSLFSNPAIFKREVRRLRLIPLMLRKRGGIQRNADSISVEYIDSLLNKNYPLNPFMKEQ